MARPLRLEFPGAVYHVTARGDRQEPIFEDNDDRVAFLELLAKETRQQGWLLYAFCLMGNHYHLLLETPEPNLVRGMRRLNGVYTQAFNHRHDRAGHVLQGRYKAIVVDKDSYLLELCRYVVLNPVRAQMVSQAGEWPWSSYLATAGKMTCPDWLAADQVLGLLASSDRTQARRAYIRFVSEGVAGPSPWGHLQGQIFLGRPVFIGRMEKLLAGNTSRGIARRQLSPGRPSAREVLKAVAEAHHIPLRSVVDRSSGEAFKHAVYLLRRRANLPLRDVAAMAGVSIGRVSQIQSRIEASAPDARLQRCLEAL
jgi:REP element-mobilizing transposase RayT